MKCLEVLYCHSEGAERLGFLWANEKQRKWMERYVVASYHRDNPNTLVKVEEIYLQPMPKYNALHLKFIYMKDRDYTTIKTFYDKIAKEGGLYEPICCTEENCIGLNCDEYQPIVLGDTQLTDWSIISQQEDLKNDK